MTRKAEENPPEDEIFDAGLEGHDAAALVGDEDVEGDGHQLQRDEEHDEVVDGGEHHETGGGEERQNDEFAAAVRDGLLDFVAYPDDEGGDDEEKEVKELGRAIPLAHAAPRKGEASCRASG